MKLIPVISNIKNLKDINGNSLTNEKNFNFVSSGNFLCRNIISRLNFRIIVLYSLCPLIKIVFPVLTIQEDFG